LKRESPGFAYDPEHHAQAQRGFESAIRKPGETCFMGRRQALSVSALGGIPLEENRADNRLPPDGKGGLLHPSTPLANESSPL